MPRHRRARHGVPAAALLVSLAVAPTAGAQVEDPNWQSTLELGTSLGATWLDGPRAPQVTSSVGYFASLGINRGISPYTSGGVTLRAGTSSISLSEVGSTWNAGRVAEISLLMNSSVESRRRSALRTSLDLLGGVTLVTGTRDVVPFRDASAISPTGEIGLSLRHGLADADASRATWGVYVHYNVMRLRMTVEDVASSGTVKRVIVGARLSR